jgi:hypothetical protein
MAHLDDVKALVAGDHGLVTVSVARPDGRVHASVVNAGVLAHPVEGREVVGLVVRGSTLKLRLVRAAGRANVVFRVGWRWAGVEGPVDIAGPDDMLEGFDPGDLAGLLRDVFAAAGGTHEDWDTYDRIMAEERRTALLVVPEHITGNP